jgi:MFS family permease
MSTGVTGKENSSMRDFLFLWSTQALSVLGSDMTSFALTLWVFQETGSALRTALLSVCSYVPYVLVSIFAGALSDRWDKKRTMLFCDAFAAACTVTVLVLFRSGMLRPWYLYVINAVSGLMNTVQRPASDVAVTLVTPKDRFQQTSGLRSLSRSVNMVLHPVLATAMYAFGGMYLVITVDLITFIIAFVSLAFMIRIPEVETDGDSEKVSVIHSAGEGLAFLGENRLVLYLILFLAGENLVASAFDSVLPAYILPLENG